MNPWTPPPGSVVRGSGHRVNPAEFAGRYACIVVALGVLAFGLALLWNGERFFEDAVGRRLREAHAAPWEVGCFALLLMGAGATKRLFGAGKRVVPALLLPLGLNVGATIVLTGIAEEHLALAAYALTAAVVVGLSAKFDAGPWTSFAFFALAFASVAGAGFSSRLPPGSDGDWALVSLVMAAGGAAGLLPFLSRLAKESPSSKP